MVGGMNEIRLSWRPGGRTKKDPKVGALDQALSPLEIRGHSHERKLVAAQRHEMAVARRPSRGQDSHDFLPDAEAAALLTHALPPATPWRHEHERGKALVGSRDRCGRHFHARPPFRYRTTRLPVRPPVVLPP